MVEILSNDIKDNSSSQKLYPAMDTVFSLSESDRSNFLRSILHTYCCTYICLWSYFPQPNLLYFLDGHYNEENNQPSGSSTASLARRLFDEYRQQVFYIVNDRIPGMAFINNQPYRELNQPELLSLTSAVLQRQFYQEARIMTAAFMGCRSGEIEMGWSNANHNNMENAMMSLFSEYNVSQQSDQFREFSQTLNPNLPSSSSSSLRSLDSQDSSSFMFNQPTVSLPEPIPITSSQFHRRAMDSLQPLVPSTSTSPHQQATQSFALSTKICLPTQEREDAAMTRAFLAVLTSSPSSSPSSSSNLTYRHQHRDGSFKSYLSSTTPIRANLRRQSMFKRAITYYGNLNIARSEHLMANRPTTTQLHHMISERRRREKINESFEALRKLLPPEPKKDKASVLTRTREYLTLLKTQISELSERNQQLDAQARSLPASAAARNVDSDKQQLDTRKERVEVRIANVSESTSEEERIVNLQVVLTGENYVADLVIRVLEFLQRVDNMNVMSVEATSSREESRSWSRLSLRLRTKGNEWDQVAFQEAVRRVVADLAQ